MDEKQLLENILATNILILSEQQAIARKLQTIAGTLQNRPQWADDPSAADAISLIKDKKAEVLALFRDISLPPQ